MGDIEDQIQKIMNKVISVRDSLSSLKFHAFDASFYDK